MSTCSTSAKNATELFLKTTTDLTLALLYFIIVSPSKKTPLDILRIQEEAHNCIGTINYDSIKKSIYQLTRTGCITRSAKRTTPDLALTEKGVHHIGQIIPKYHASRPWNGHVFLISYDVPANANNKRNFLRHSIKLLSGAKLQESLYMTPYDPTLLLKKLRAQHAIPGNILISNLGVGGSIGEESLSDLVSRVYMLDQLEKRYLGYLELFPASSKPSIPAQLSYLSILRDDPQLPYELLPQNFPDRRAHERYLSLRP